MSKIRLALANVRPASCREESLRIVLESIKSASDGGAAIICFPECFLPGYRIAAMDSPPDQGWLNHVWSNVDSHAAKYETGVILGTERIESDRLLITARVTNAQGSFVGFQDKVQLDPSEELTYSPGAGRRIFESGGLRFGVVICHEGWRYPETVRWAARQGAHVVFHPHFELVEDEQFMPAHFADTANTFHEKAALCRAAENTCYIATVNCALRGCTTTSAIVDPDGVLLTHHPYGAHGILFGDIDTDLATGLLAKRFKPESVYD